LSFLIDMFGWLESNLGRSDLVNRFTIYYSYRSPIIYRLYWLIVEDNHIWSSIWMTNGIMFFCIEGTIFYASGQELLTLPEHLSSPTDFDHHLQTLLVNCRRRSHLILYLDDERNCVLFVLKELYFMLVEQELLTLPKHLHSPR
jgi:hypothetical protein